MNWKLLACLGLAAAPATLSAQNVVENRLQSEDSTDTDAAPAPIVIPPPARHVLRDTTPAAPAVEKKRPPRFGTLEEEIAEWGAIPASVGTWPADRKEAKKLRRWASPYETLCYRNEELMSSIASTRLDACNQLLAAPTNPDRRPVERAQMLHGRAISLIYLGGHRLALQALDEADAIGMAHHGPMYRSSAGLGNNLLRAFVYQQMNEPEKAEVILEEVRQARPYAASLVQAADVIELSNANSVDLMQQRLVDRVRIDPDVQRILFISYILQGKMELANALGDRVSLTAPKMRGAWKMEDAPSEVEDLRQSTFVNGLRAYAAAAMGYGAKSSGILEEARGDIDDYLGDDPTQSTYRYQRTSKKLIREYAARKAVAIGLKAMLESYAGAIELRTRASNLTTEELMTEVTALGQMGALFPTVIDQLGMVQGEDAVIAKRLVRTLTASTLRSAMEVELGQLPILMPKLETIDQVPKIASTGSKWLFSDGSGWSQARERGSDIRTVRYETLVGSKAMMEEMLLLAIAQLAEKEGFDSFVMLSNRTFARVTRHVGYYNNSTTSSGFESQARVMLLDSAALPPEMVNQRERLITIAEIKAELEPRYDAIMAQKEAEKTRQ